MTPSEARQIIGNQPEWAVRNMAFALTLHSWNNSPDDWQRLEAAVIVLGRKAPKRARVNW
jgi:hypothetical protein